MTIESASYPENLAGWEAAEQPFYLELFGETSPEVDIHYAEASSPSSTDPDNPVARSSPIYEYYWTIGHPGLPRNAEGLSRFLHLGKPGATERAEKLWGHLKDDPAATVYVFFPLGGGWRIKELVATVKYLTPVREQQNLMDQAAKEWQQLQPVVDGAGTVARLAAPALGPIGVGASTALSAIAKLKVDSVPQAKGFEWSAGKVTFASRAGVMQGVMWDLPRNMFAVLGGRLTGSVAVSFIPDRRQARGQVAREMPPPEPLDVLSHAVVYGPDQDHWAPGIRDFVHLTVSPRLPPSGAGAPDGGQSVG